MVDGSNITHLPGIYLHIPFCEKKCNYCDFFSVVSFESRNQFLNAMIKELELRFIKIDKSIRFDTIYIGGGTPSVLTENELEKILAALKSLVILDDNTEITIEVNPESIDKNKLHFYKSSGISRLSIGIQSFLNHELISLGRIHSVHDALNAYEWSRQAGFDNINIDLIYGLPDQNFETWLHSLGKAISLKPEHISAYSLILEEGTPLHDKLIKGKINQRCSDEEYRFLHGTIKFLESAGYLQYEISNFATKESNISRHNYKYWNHSPYFGFGPSAHSYWQRVRWSNVRSLGDYIEKLNNNKLPVLQTESIKEDTYLFERILLSLRTTKGLDLRKFRSDFSKTFQNINKSLTDHLVTEGFAVFEDDHFRLTKKGLCITDEIISNFVPA